MADCGSVGTATALLVLVGSSSCLDYHAMGCCLFPKSSLAFLKQIVFPESSTNAVCKAHMC